MKTVIRRVSTDDAIALSPVGVKTSETGYMGFVSAKDLDDMDVTDNGNYYSERLIYLEPGAVEQKGVIVGWAGLCQSSQEPICRTVSINGEPSTLSLKMRPRLSSTLKEVAFGHVCKTKAKGIILWLSEGDGRPQALHGRQVPRNGAHKPARSGAGTGFNFDILALD